MGLRAIGSIRVRYCAPHRVFHCESETMQYTIEHVARFGGAIRVARPVWKKSCRNAAAGRERVHD